MGDDISTARAIDSTFTARVVRTISRTSKSVVNESFRVLLDAEASVEDWIRHGEEIVAVYDLVDQPKLGPVSVLRREFADDRLPEVVTAERFGGNVSLALAQTPPRVVDVSGVSPLEENEFRALLQQASLAGAEDPISRLVDLLAGMDLEDIGRFALRFSLAISELDTPALAERAHDPLRSPTDPSLLLRARAVMSGTEAGSVNPDAASDADALDAETIRRLSVASDAYSRRAGEETLLATGVALSSGSHRGHWGSRARPVNTDDFEGRRESLKRDLRATFALQRASHAAPATIDETDIWWDVDNLRQWFGVRFFTRGSNATYTEHLDLVTTPYFSTEGPSPIRGLGQSLADVNSHVHDVVKAENAELLAIEIFPTSMKLNNQETFLIQRRTNLPTPEYIERFVSAVLG